MSSRERRQSELLFSWQTLGIVAMLVIAGASLALILALASLVVLSDGSRHGVAPPELLVARLVLFSAAGAAGIFALLRYRRRIARQYVRRESVKLPGIVQHLDKVEATEGRYSLILRPFGADGFITLRQRRSALSRAVAPGRMTRTAEQLIAEASKAVLNAEAVAVASPTDKELSPGPQYLLAGRDWQPEVAALISRAYCVFLVFPPQRGRTLGLSWEIEELARLGLLGRVIAVFPDRRRKSPELFAQILDSLEHLFPVRACLEAVSVRQQDVIMVLLSENFRVWSQKPTEPFWRRGVDDAFYLEPLRECLTLMEGDSSVALDKDTYPYFANRRSRLRDLSLVPEQTTRDASHDGR